MGQFRSRCFATGVVALLAFPAPAWAKKRPPSADEIRDAAEAFDRGRAAFRSNGYVEAAENFEAADSYAPSAQALLLAIKSRVAADQMARALTLAELALSLYSDDDAVQSEARKLLETHAGELGKLNVSCDDACELLLDGKLVHGRASTQRTIYVDPGMHRLRANWADASAKSLGVRIDAGGFEILNFVAPAEGDKAATDAWLAGKSGSDASSENAEEGKEASLPKDQPSESKRKGWSPAIFWTGVGVTSLGVGVSTFLGIRAINEPGTERVNEACGNNSPDCSDLVQQGVRNQNATNISIGITAGVAALTAITGLVLTDWKGHEGKPNEKKTTARAPSWEPWIVVGDGVNLGARGRF